MDCNVGSVGSILFPDKPEKIVVYDRFHNLYNALCEVANYLTFDVLTDYHTSDIDKPYPKEVYDILYAFRNDCEALVHQTFPIQWYLLRGGVDALLVKHQHQLKASQREKNETDDYFAKTAEQNRQYNSKYPMHIIRTTTPIHYDNETIVITDPCYLESGKNQKDLDYFNFQPAKPYIFTSTLYGDWACHTLLNTDEFNKVDEEMDAYRHDWMYPLIRYGNSAKVKELKEQLDKFVLGQFCADSGNVIVCSLQDALIFNPEFEEFVKKHYWCVTKIENFTGDVLYHEVDRHTCYLEGIGNIPFITRQTGL
ncbi:MAG: hypothetical protein LBC02_01035 [Planctomycetaceae bacterium]|jgi:hypothetical protein|nr:hypothetical protein [Planctomycetaceae bacterium]